MAGDVAAINHARDQTRLVFKNNAEEIFETNESVEKIYDVTGTVIRRVIDVKSIKNRVITFFEF